MASCLMFELQKMVFARCLELRNTGTSMAIKIAIIEITASNSVSVNAERFIDAYYKGSSLMNQQKGQIEILSYLPFLEITWATHHPGTHRQGYAHALI
jgi:hypothetical protein